jgi:hypothetical protein
MLRTGIEGNMSMRKCFASILASKPNFWLLHWNADQICNLGSSHQFSDAAIVEHTAVHENMQVLLHAPHHATDSSVERERKKRRRQRD